MKSAKFKIIVLSVLFAAGLIITYSNHFHNEFHFDDSHTIQSNPYITDIHNIPLFFKDSRTFSSMPSHWSYRPMVTATLAVDYWVGGGLKPFYFHLSTFLWYTVLCLLLYVIYKKIIDKSISHKWTGYFALFAASLYAFHTANAETINYIISRSDVLSTLCMVASLAIYISYPKLRKSYLYVLPALIGVLFKETVMALPVILFFYILFFETKYSVYDIFKKKTFNKVFKLFLNILPVIILLAAAQFYTLHKTHAIELTSSPLYYILTQAFVWVHYFFTFFLPANLSADTDLKVFTNLFDGRIIIGFAFITLLIIVIFKTSKKPEYRPVSFGLIWFAAALLPTSLAPLSEAMNDHRMFFPFIGLALSVVYSLCLVIVKYEKVIAKEKKYQVFIWIVSCFILSAYAYGTFQRNKVWKNEETLWLDVTKKSPANGRGLMNYGLTQMSKGNYETALGYYEKALVYNPYYPFLHVNFGILKNAMNKPDEAEACFKKAIRYGARYHEPYYYYADFLWKHYRPSDAMQMIEKALQINPYYLQGLYKAMDIYLETGLWDKLNSAAMQALAIAPGDSTTLRYMEAGKKRMSKLDESIAFAQNNPTPENFLNLSLIYYQKGLYEKCIDACYRAIELRPNYAEAYNNICSAYNALGKYGDAAKACKKAIAIKPDFKLAKNNLAWAENQREK